MNNSASALSEVFKKVKGKVFKDYDISKLTFFKTGGSADYLFIPQSKDDLFFFLQNKPEDIPVSVLGAGSNVLIRDGGIRGVTIKLLGLNKIDNNNGIITADAGASDKALAMYAQSKGIEGFEFLYTIPGSVGGAVVMNAGAYKREMKDVFLSAQVIDDQGHISEISKEQAQFCYRSSFFKSFPQYIILSVCVAGNCGGDPVKIKQTMQLMEESRLKTQPLAIERTAGSTFKNPDGYKAWELVSKVGGEDLFVGGARVSGKHNNFLLNHSKATAQDIEDLGNLIVRKVLDEFNIKLEWEIKIVGERKA